MVLNHLESRMRPSPIRGFTLTELLVVIAIIAGMAGLMAMGMAKMKQKRDLDGAKMLVSQITVAMAAYPITRWATGNPPVGSDRPLWAISASGTAALDVTPDVTGGFLAMTGCEVPERFIRRDPVTKVPTRIVDPWGMDIFVAVSNSLRWCTDRDGCPSIGSLGSSAYGAYSCGPNKRDNGAVYDEATSKDDIIGW